jgi:hypothetical protein
MAGASASVKVTGANEFEARMRRAAVQMSDMRAPGMRAAQKVVARARVLCPVKTGRLQASIHPEVDRQRAQVIAGQGLAYAKVQHWGWPAHNIRATLFLTNALVQTQPQWIVDYQQAIDAIVARVEG